MAPPGQTTNLPADAPPSTNEPEHRDEKSSAQPVVEVRGRLARSLACRDLFLPLALQPRPKKAINRYPSEVIPSLAFTYTRGTGVHVHSRTLTQADARSRVLRAQSAERRAQGAGLPAVLDAIAHSGMGNASCQSPGAPNELRYFILTPVYTRADWLYWQRG